MAASILAPSLDLVSPPVQRLRTLHWLPGGLLLGGLLLEALCAMTPAAVSTQYSREVGGPCALVAPAAADASPYIQNVKLSFGHSEMEVVEIPLGALPPAGLETREAALGARARAHRQDHHR
jgi:hypothetical protein